MKERIEEEHNEIKEILNYDHKVFVYTYMNMISIEVAIPFKL